MMPAVARLPVPPIAAGKAPRRARAERRPEPALSLLRDAHADPAAALPAELIGRLERHVAADFTGVRVHRGAASQRASDRLGARAYTLGRHVHLGADAAMLDGAALQALLAHEAVHAVQQGGGSPSLDGTVRLGAPGDASEAEAEAIAARCLAAPSRAGAQPPAQPLLQRHAPRIQRHLRGPYATPDGTFNLDMRTVSAPGGDSGMMGLIEFRAAPQTPDSEHIRLLQVVKVTAGSAGLDLQWSGDQADRNKVRTTEDTPHGITGGYFVDHNPAKAQPRGKAKDKAVSPYYNDYYKSPKISREGRKKGSTVEPAVLGDFPGSISERVFRFETAAKATETGYLYASLEWGFEISDAAKGTVTGEFARASWVQSNTFDAAVGAFDEFYRNPGAASAPTK